ncbi:unnamed protein product [Chrysoparadoxa australica]
MIDTTGASEGTGHGIVEHLCVRMDQRRRGIGLLLLRRAEGIMMSLRCRWVSMRVLVPAAADATDVARGSTSTCPHGGVVQWTLKAGYEEVGGGILEAGERYMDVRHDLLTDASVDEKYGVNSARYWQSVSSARDDDAVPEIPGKSDADVLPAPPPVVEMAPVSDVPVPARESATENSCSEGSGDPLESLLAGLLRTLNTDEGRVEFNALATPL